MSCADCVHLSAARAAPEAPAHGDMSWRCAALVGCAFRRSAPSLIAGGNLFLRVVVGRTRAGYVARAFPHFVIGGLDPAIHADTRMLDRAFWRATARQHGHRVRPGVDEKGERPRRPQAAKGERGYGAQNRRRIPVARLATRHGKTRAQTRRGNNRGPARPLLQCSRVSNGRASDRQTNVQLLESV